MRSEATSSEGAFTGYRCLTPILPYVTSLLLTPPPLQPVLKDATKRQRNGGGREVNASPTRDGFGRRDNDEDSLSIGGSSKSIGSKNPSRRRLGRSVERANNSNNDTSNDEDSVTRRGRRPGRGASTERGRSKERGTSITDGSDDALSVGGTSRKAGRRTGRGSSIERNRNSSLSGEEDSRVPVRGRSSVRAGKKRDGSGGGSYSRSPSLDRITSGKATEGISDFKAKLAEQQARRRSEIEERRKNRRETR